MSDSTPYGKGKTSVSLRNALLSGTSPLPSDADLQGDLKRIEEAFADPDPITGSEKAIIIAMERSRQLAKLVPDLPGYTVSDSRTGRVICTSADDDYLAKYRAYMAEYRRQQAG
jgi:hypothetical protein